MSWITALKITPIHCLPYHGQSKPIERFFGTVEQATPVWDTYCGKDVLSKPEDLQKMLDRGHAPAVADFSQWFSDWLTGWHATHEHSGQGMNGQTPDAVFAANMGQITPVAPELLQVLSFAPAPPVKLGQNGVTLRGLRYGAGDPALFEHLGKDVVVRVDNDCINRVLIFDTVGKFLCAAQANAQIPANATRDEQRQASRAKAQHRKLLKTYINEQPRMADDMPDLLVRARQAKRTAADAIPGKAHLPPPPPVFRTVGQPENYWRGKVRRRDFECGERMVRKIETMAPLTDYKVPGLCMRFTHGRTDRVDRLTPGEAYCVVEMLKAAVERKESAEIYAAEIASDGATGGEEELPF